METSHAARRVNSIFLLVAGCALRSLRGPEVVVELSRERLHVIVVEGSAIHNTLPHKFIELCSEQVRSLYPQGAAIGNLFSTKLVKTWLFKDSPPVRKPRAEPTCV